MSEQETRIEKICPVVLRSGASGLEILALRHPETGLQLVQGAHEPGTAARDSAARTLQEESGLTAKALHDLGKSKGIAPQEAWHFFLCACDGVPDAFTHPAKDWNGDDLAFFWQPVEGFLDEEEWHPVFIRAMRFVQTRLAKMDESVRNRFVPGSRSTLGDTILEMALDRGADKSLCPSEVARHLAGQDEKQWRALMKPIREEAVRLARAGAVAITRKGKPVDPDDFRGIYRIALPKGEESA